MLGRTLLALLDLLYDGARCFSSEYIQAIAISDACDEKLLRADTCPA